MGLVFYLLAAAVLLAALVAVVVLVVGAVLGGALGGAAGALRGARKAPPAEGELGAYRGLVWGGCLGVGLGLLAAVVLLAVAWGYVTAPPPPAATPSTYATRKG